MPNKEGSLRNRTQIDSDNRQGCMSLIVRKVIEHNRGKRSKASIQEMDPPCGIEGNYKSPISTNYMRTFGVRDGKCKKQP